MCSPWRSGSGRLWWEGRLLLLSRDVRWGGAMVWFYSRCQGQRGRLKTGRVLVGWDRN